MKNTILFAKNQEYVSQKCEKFYFLTKYRISAQNRIRPCDDDECLPSRFPPDLMACRYRTAGFLKKRKFTIQTMTPPPVRT